MNTDPNLLLFFGRFHPLLVHLPIGFLVLLALLETLAQFRRFHGANACAGYALALLVPAAAASAACGWLLSTSGDYDGRLLRVHRWLGVATTVFCTFAAVCYLRQWRRTYVVSLYSSAVVLAVTSHFGGSLTHGADYLTRYAPRPIKTLLGGRTPIARVGTSGQTKGVFPTVVQPILQARCERCHGPEKRKGGLRLDSFDRLMKGGEDGPVILAGEADKSPLVRRLLLPLEHDDHMPPSGKPQPTPQEISVVRWWINAGAPLDEPLKHFHLPADVQRAIRSMSERSKPNDEAGLMSDRHNRP